MSDLNLIINQDAVNRSLSLMSKTGSNAVPLSNINLVFADIYDTRLTFVNGAGNTGSYFPLTGSTATLALGLPGSAALAVATCSIASSSSYACLFHLNTNELSSSLGNQRSRQYVLELQVISGSSVLSFQNPATVYRDVTINALYPLNIDYIISASFASFATSASYALSSSYAPKQWNESGSNTFYTFRNVGIDCIPNNANLHIRAAEYGTAILITDTGSLNNTFILQTVAGVPTITMYNVDGTIGSNFTAGGLSLSDGNTPGEVVIGASGNSYINNTDNFGLGTNSPNAKLHVQGNISASAITASLNADTYKLNTGFANYYNASTTASNADDGKVMVFTTGSKCILTGSLNTHFSTTIIQSGSSQIMVSGSAGVVVRNRQGFYSTAGQYAAVSVMRLANGDFYVFGDAA